MLGALRELRWISADAYASALNAPLSLKRGSYGTAASSPFVFDQVRQELNAQAARQARRARGPARRTPRSTSGCSSPRRPRDQGRAQVAGRSFRGARSRSTCTTATCCALATSDYGSDANQFNLATAARRSPGSTFKLFALVDALRRGADPDSVYYPSGYVSFPEDDPVCPQAGGWSPHNADGGGGGYMSLETATVHSVNVVYAQLMRDLGPAQVAATAHLLGIRSKLPLHCSMVLGADEVTPLELTSAYATIAGRGVYHRPRVIRRVEDAATGKIVADKAFHVRAKRVVSPAVAYETTKILEGVVESGTGTRARLDDGRPQAGKTGTAENYGNAWFCGYTPDIASCVWVGYRSSNKPLENVEGFGAVYGGTIPAEIWKNFMTTATRRLPPHDWAEPKMRWSTGPSRPTTSFGYNPAPPAAPTPPPAKAKPKQEAPPSTPTKVVIAPQNG